MNHIFPKAEISIGTNYILQLKNLLGSGSFGKIYKGKNTPLNIDLAIKCEPLESKHHQRRCVCIRGLNPVQNTV